MCDSPAKLRKFFPILQKNLHNLLIFCHITDPSMDHKFQFEKFKDSLAEDIKHQIKRKLQGCAEVSIYEIYNRCLLNIEDI